jgi:hypothetical protein
VNFARSTQMNQNADLDKMFVTIISFLENLTLRPQISRREFGKRKMKGLN